ncbi:MAG: hypothetical protein GY795_37435 [Desulfobacterales bacterium]|nr:hypothetical protein [Desulfobacterales bacterium]
MKKLFIIGMMCFFFLLMAGNTSAKAGSSPTANAGPNQTVYEGVTVTLDGSLSSDPDDDIVSYTWTQISGISVVLSDPTAIRPVFDAPDVGEDGDSITFKLKVTDKEELQSTDTCVIEILWLNAAPVADAGPDRTVAEGFAVTLDGSGSYDPDDNIVSYEWTQSAGSVPVSLSDPAIAKPVFTAPEVGSDGGSLVFKLKVTDAGGLESTDTCIVNVTWTNSAPIANAGPNQAVDEGVTVTLDGSESYDPDDEIVSYEWTQTAGPFVSLSDPASVTPFFTAPEADSDGVSLEFSLKVTDSGELESSDTCIINVSWINTPPVADTGGDRTIDEGTVVTLDGSGSSDPDNDIVSYEWTQASGTPVTLSDSTSVRPTFTAPDVGPGGAFLTFSLKVTDSGGLYSSDTCGVKVSWINIAPVADAGHDRTVSGGVTVILDASGSSDPDNGISSYQWKQVSGQLVYLSDLNSTKTSFTAPDPGQGSISLAFSLTVTDNQGLEGTDSCIINISRTNIAPIASAGPDQTVNEGAAVTLDASGSSDPDDGIAFYEWTQTSGTSVTLSDSTLIRPTFNAPDVGPRGESLIFNLKITDSGGLQSTDTCKVNISWVNAAPVADAGANQIVDEGTVAVLDASGSSDPDNDIVSYEWTQVSGTPAALSDITVTDPFFTTPGVGPHGASLAFKLKVTDSGGLQSADTCIVNVSWINDSPIADAGTDRTVYEGDTVALDASGSSDPDDGIAFYEWTQTSGTTVILSDSAVIMLSFTAPNVEADGETLTFELTVADNGGLESSDTCSIKILKAGVHDRDGDNVPDDQDAFPDNRDEWLDTDKDGLGNNADEDDDDDEMPDEWEIKYGLNPLADDSLEDPDRDGVRNIDEYKAGTNPMETQGQANLPVLSSPANGLAGVSLTPELVTEELSDTDSDKKHEETEWQISKESDFSSLVLDITSSRYLTSFTVPEFVLNRYTTYYWRARFYFDDSSVSEWPVCFSFTTTLIPSEEDRNFNGIPDNQEITDPKVDLDSDGTPDADQDNISSIETAVGTAQVGITGLTNVASVESVKSVDPADISETENRPVNMVFGLVSLALNVDNPGDVATVNLYFSEPAPNGDKWYNYDPVNGWWDYSEHAAFSDDRKSVRMELKDGGFGDSDGTENGVVIDQSGSGTPSSTSNGGAGDSSGSCFISGSCNSMWNTGAYMIGFVIFCAVFICLNRDYRKQVNSGSAPPA